MTRQESHIRLTYPATVQFLRQVRADPEIRLEWDRKRPLLRGFADSSEPVFELLLPLPMPSFHPLNTPPGQYIDALSEEIPDYMIVLIQTGASAMGYFEAGEVIHHKAIKKYMKRHKQGKSQLNYLKTRGKSKAGSRIRLANAVRFFIEINERLTEWENEYEPDRILYSCTPQLWGFLFQATPPPPFEKKDPRLIKIPKDIHIPTHEELMKVNEFGLWGWLRKTGDFSF